MSFRISFGNGNCSGKPNSALVSDLCRKISAKLEYLRNLSPTQLLSLDDEREKMSIAGRRAELSLYRAKTTNGATLIVVQGFVSTFRWPTFISAAGVGHIVAEGLMVESNGSITSAPDDVLWEYR